MEIQQLKSKFSTGKTPTGQDYADLLDATFNAPPIAVDNPQHENDIAPHQYGGKFEWRYNATTNSLDLVVLP